MKLPTFTLVQCHAASGEKTAKGGGRSTGTKKNLAATIKASIDSGVLTKESAQLVAKDLGRRKKVETVGIWDLGAWVGRLPRIIEAMNEAQPNLTIFDVQASAPAALTSRKQRVAGWAEQTLKRKLRKDEREWLTDAIIDMDFFPHADRVRKAVGLDYLVGLTAEPIAGEDIDARKNRHVYSDFFSSNDGRVCLVSTSGLRKLAERANRPFEFAAAYVFLSALLAAMNPKLKFHDESRGCLLDYNEDRREIVKGFKSPGIDSDCLSRIKPAYREMVTTLLKTLHNYQGEATA